MKRVVIFILTLSIAVTSLNAQSSISVKIKKIYPMGKKIYNKKCSIIKVSSFKSYDELRSEIVTKKLCKPLSKKHLYALSRYLWDVKGVEKNGDSKQVIEVTKDEKCPVCGMLVYKYSKWAAQIFYKESHFSFDGVKDMMKYYFKHKSDISKILVTDYYSQKVIDARRAYFVVGSDVFGPMGDELIPFEMQSEAKAFSMDHKGLKVLKFYELSKEEVYK